MVLAFCNMVILCFTCNTACRACPQFLEPFPVIRFMDWMHTNAEGDRLPASWQQRPTPADRCCSAPDAVFRSLGLRDYLHVLMVVHANDRMPADRCCSAPDTFVRSVGQY